MAIRVPLLCVPSHLLAARGEDRGPLFFAPEILFKEFLESEVPECNLMIFYFCYKV